MYRVLSFDLFLTLADLNARVPILWERIFGHALTPDEVTRHAEGLKAHYLPNYHALARMPFRPMSAVFRQGFADYFADAGIDADPDRAAEIFLEEHNLCPIYPDAAALLRRVQGRYRVVISSDADMCMVEGLLSRIPHERAFVSEALEAYKADRNGAFFRRVLEDTGVEPGEILHIGDGRSDIVGARGSGIDVYHVDRDGLRLSPDLAGLPTYSGRDLTGLYDILEL